MDDRAAKFAEAYRNLDLFPLYSTEEIERFGVEYGRATLARLQSMILLSGDNAKLIFTGHRGCGKSTLLGNLAREMRKQNLFVLGFSIADMVEMSDINHINILYSIAIRLLEKALAENLVTVSQAEHEELLKWFSRTVITTHTEAAGGEVSIGVDFLGVAKAGLKNDRQFRKQITDKLERRVSELSERINTIAAAIEKASGLKVLVIIDDLDKLDLATVKPIFQENIKALFSPNIRVVFTIPIAVIRETRLMDTIKTRSKVIQLPVTKFFERAAAHKSGATPIEENVAMLETVLKRRIPETLITPEAMKQLVLLSGGVLREMVRLGQECCRECMLVLDMEPERTTVKIDEAILQQAARNLRIEFSRPLGSKLLAVLQQTYENFEPEDANSQDFLELLHGLYVLEYENGELWYDLHPLIQDLMQRKDLI